MHPIGPAHPPPSPILHPIRRVEVVAPAVVDRPLIDSPCRAGHLCDRFERATVANRFEQGGIAEQIERATFAERLLQQNIVIRRAETNAESLDRFVSEQPPQTPTTTPTTAPVNRSDDRLDTTLKPGPQVELPEIDKPIYRDVIERKIEVVDVLSRGNLIDILA